MVNQDSLIIFFISKFDKLLISSHGKIIRAFLKSLSFTNVENLLLFFLNLLKFQSGVQIFHSNKNIQETLLDLKRILDAICPGLKKIYIRAWWRENGD